MKKITLATAAAALIVAACAEPEEEKAETPTTVLTADGQTAICGDGHYERTWLAALACGDTIYRPLKADSDVWIDPEFKCEYFLSRYHDGSALRLGPGAPRMAIVDGNYVHVCRTFPTTAE